MTKTIINSKNEKINVSYITTPSQVYTVTEVVEGGEAWDADKIYQNHNKIVDAIHRGYSKI